MIKVILFLAVLAVTAYSQVCSDLDVSDLTSLSDDSCNGNGYCVVGVNDDSLYGCSCLPGFGGANCDDPCDRTCVANNVENDGSFFATSLDGSFDESNGNILLAVTAPIEDIEADGADGNYATYTTHRFLNEDSCDYPEADNTAWTKVFDDVNCTETYNSDTTISDLLGCTGVADVVCKDNSGNEVDCTQPDECTDLPCTRCYPGQILSTRGYVRTAPNGFSAGATAENCHYFEVCLPWIQDVETDITVTVVPEFENDFILTRVAFHCFEAVFDTDCVTDDDESWLIEIVSETAYPWYVEETGEDEGGLRDSDGFEFDLVHISEVSGCSSEEEGPCRQKFQFAIPECRSLEEQDVYEIIGLQYECHGECADVKATLGDALLVEASVTLQASQENCGADFSIDATETITLDMAAYTDDTFTELNAVFVENDEDLGTAFFKIDIDSNIPITGANLLSVTQLGDDAVYVEDEHYTIVDCGDDLCFSMSVDLLIVDIDTDEIVPVTVVATIEVDYTGTKRSLAIGNNFELNQNIQVLGSKEEQTSSAVSVASFAMLSVAYLF